MQRRNSNSQRLSNSGSPSIFPALSSSQPPATTQPKHFFSSDSQALRSAARLRRSPTLPASDTNRRDVTQWLMSLKWPANSADLDVATCCEVLRSLCWNEVEQLHTQDLWDLGIRCPHVSRFIIQQIAELRMQDAFGDGSEHRAALLRKQIRANSSSEATQSYRLDMPDKELETFAQIPSAVRDSLASLRVGGTFSELRGGRDRDERTLRRSRSEVSSALRAWYKTKGPSPVTDHASINLQGKVLDASARMRRPGLAAGKFSVIAATSEVRGVLRNPSDGGSVLQGCLADAGATMSSAGRQQRGEDRTAADRQSAGGAATVSAESSGGGLGLTVAEEEGGRTRARQCGAPAPLPTDEELSSWSTEENSQPAAHVSLAELLHTTDMALRELAPACTNDEQQGSSESRAEGDVEGDDAAMEGGSAKKEEEEREGGGAGHGGVSDVGKDGHVSSAEEEAAVKLELARLQRHMLRKLDPICFGNGVFQRPSAPSLRTDAASFPPREPLWTHGGGSGGNRNGNGNGGRRSTRVVYDYAAISADKGYNSEMRYGSMLSSTYYQPTGPDDTTLVFDSRFESGNLSLVHQHGRYTPQFEGSREYDLYLTADTNASGEGHKVWFFFSVRNCRARCEYKLRISNMTKNNSLFGRGQRPLFYSEQRAAIDGVGWHRVGDGISYAAIPPESLTGSRNLRRSNSSNEELFALCFTLQFPYDNDTCYLAFAYPYSYSRLQHDLADVMEHSAARGIVHRQQLCQSNAGNRLDLLTITAPATHGADMAARKAVVFTARVHPGETNSSWIMKGLIDFLVSDDEVAAQLRSRFVFKLIPMLNPDGVVNGNCRFGSTGQDLNRQWRRPDSKDHPEIFHTRSMIEATAKERELVLFCDIHGHSQKFNAFLYGCDASSWAGYPHKTPGPELEERVFPARLCQMSPHYDYKFCCFRPISKKKECTGRVVVWRQYIQRSYTLEASLAGCIKEGEGYGLHFNLQHFEQMGRAIGPALLDALDDDAEAVRRMMAPLMDGIHAHRQAQLQDVVRDEYENDKDNSESDAEETAGKPQPTARSDSVRNGLGVSKTDSSPGRPHPPPPPPPPSVQPAAAADGKACRPNAAQPTRPSPDRVSSRDAVTAHIAPPINTESLTDKERRSSRLVATVGTRCTPSLADSASVPLVVVSSFSAPTADKTSPGAPSYVASVSVQGGFALRGSGKMLEGDGSLSARSDLTPQETQAGVSPRRLAGGGIMTTTLLGAPPAPMPPLHPKSDASQLPPTNSADSPGRSPAVSPQAVPLRGGVAVRRAGSMAGGAAPNTFRHSRRGSPGWPGQGSGLAVVPSGASAAGPANDRHFDSGPDSPGQNLNLSLDSGSPTRNRNLNQPTPGLLLPATGVSSGAVAEEGARGQSSARVAPTVTGYDGVAGLNLNRTASSSSRLQSQTHAASGGGVPPAAAEAGDQGQGGKSTAGPPSVPVQVPGPGLRTVREGSGAGYTVFLPSAVSLAVQTSGFPQRPGPVPVPISHSDERRPLRSMLAHPERR